MRRSNETLFSLAPFTLIALAANLILYAVTVMRSHSLVTMNTGVLWAMGASQREGLWVGEWNRLVMPMFLHGGLTHIGMNMFYLWRAGPDAEIYFGTSNYASIYLLSGVCGVCLSQIFGGHLSIGASGCLCGIMGAHLAVLILNAPLPKQAWRNSAVRREAYALGFLLLIGILGLFRMDNWGHFGGIIMGLAMGLFFELWRRRKRAGQVGIVAVLILSGVLVCAARWTIFNPTYHIFQCAQAKQDHDPDADTYHRTEAQQWAQRWKSLHFLGVLNPAETDAVLAALDLGRWDAKTAVNWRGTMTFICAAFKKGNFRYDMTHLPEEY